MTPSAAEATFIGRHEELGFLEAGVREARARRGRVLGITGDPGIGKTRLVEEFTRRLAPATGAVLWGRCPEQADAPAYWPWRQALAPLLVRDADAVPAGLLVDQRLQRTLALLAMDASGGADAEGPAATSRFVVFDAVAQLLRRASEDAALVVVLDDVHWADGASLELLAHVARELRGSRVLLVITYCEPEMRRRATFLGDIARTSRRIALHGLARDDVERFVAMSGVAEPSPGLVARLHETTDGNPFFLDELIALLRDTGTLEALGDASRPVTELPDGVRETVRRRVDPLPDTTRELLALAAVVGREFTIGIRDGVR